MDSETTFRSAHFQLNIEIDQIKIALQDCPTMEKIVNPLSLIKTVKKNIVQA
jgi:hypothetical protein